MHRIRAPSHVDPWNLKPGRLQHPFSRYQDLSSFRDVNLKILAELSSISSLGLDGGQLSLALVSLRQSRQVLLIVLHRHPLCAMSRCFPSNLAHLSRFIHLFDGGMYARANDLVVQQSARHCNSSICRAGRSWVMVERDKTEAYTRWHRTNRSDMPMEQRGEGDFSSVR
jgi:hypothetical protein